MGKINGYNYISEEDKIFIQDLLGHCNVFSIANVTNFVVGSVGELLYKLENTKMTYEDSLKEYKNIYEEYLNTVVNGEEANDAAKSIFTYEIGMRKIFEDVIYEHIPNNSLLKPNDYLYGGMTPEEMEKLEHDISSSMHTLTVEENKLAKARGNATDVVSNNLSQALNRNVKMDNVLVNYVLAKDNRATLSFREKWLSFSGLKQGYTMWKAERYLNSELKAKHSNETVESLCESLKAERYTLAKDYFAPVYTMMHKASMYGTDFLESNKEYTRNYVDSNKESAPVEELKSTELEPFSLPSNASEAKMEIEYPDVEQNLNIDALLASL